MAEYQQQAIQVLAPEAPSVVAVTASSSSATAIPSGGSGRWLSVAAIGTNCFVLFGTSGVAAADANDWPIADGTVQHFLLQEGVTHFRVIGAGTGTFHYYTSSP